MTHLRIATIAGIPEREATFTAEVGARHDVEVVMRCVDRIELLACIRGANLDGIVCIGAPGWVDAQAIDEASRARIRVVGVVGDPLDAERLRRSQIPLAPPDATADDVLAMLRADAPEPRQRPTTPPPLPGAHGKLIAVWGPKGAPGRTAVALELAHELARDEERTLLVDGDPYGGDIVQLLGIVEEIPTIVWAARMAAKEELDASRMTVELRRSDRMGPVLLPGLPRAALWAEISDFGWRQLLSVARGAFRFTVCDVGFCLEPEASLYPNAGEGRNRIARASVAAADVVIAVCRCDPMGLKNFLWSFDDLRDLVDRDRVVVVANRIRPGDERDVARLLKSHIGKHPLAYVPDRPHVFARATADAEPVTRTKGGADVRNALESVLTAIGGQRPPSGVMSRLARGRS